MSLRIKLRLSESRRVAHRIAPVDRVDLLDRGVGLGVRARRGLRPCRGGERPSRAAGLMVL